MSFRDNLLHLRASRNMTQEQLAMMLGVSRQSVTKWESERSYPEMDKLIKLCQVFDCTLDDLVQGDLTDRQPNPTSAISANPPADVFGYDEHMRRHANKISTGIFSILLGCAISIIFFNAGDPQISIILRMPENIGDALGTLCVLAGIVCSLALFIPAGMEHSQFVRRHPFIEDFYTEDDKAQIRKAFSWQLIGGITLIFIGVCTVIFFDGSSYEDTLGVVIMMLLISVGAPLIVHGGMTLSRTNLANYNLAASEVMESHEIEKANMPSQQKADLLAAKRTGKRIGAVCGTIMMLATIAGLVMLFVPQYFTPFFWLAWPIGGLCCGIAAVLIKGFSNDE